VTGADAVKQPVACRVCAFHNGPVKGENIQIFSIPFIIHRRHVSVGFPPFSPKPSHDMDHSHIGP
jgi:hypothetical protein